MDNLKLPAYPQPVAATGEKNDAMYSTADYKPDYIGFTKLELASLMIASGMLANSPDWSEKETAIKWVGKHSVRYAKSVLTEANK